MHFVPKIFGPNSIQSNQPDANQLSFDLPSQDNLGVLDPCVFGLSQGSSLRPHLGERKYPVSQLQRGRSGSMPPMPEHALQLRLEFGLMQWTRQSDDTNGREKGKVSR